MRTAFARGVALAALSTSALFGFAAPALAQAADAGTAAETATDNAETGEIIVSARRRSETLQTTPIAITAITASTFENKASPNIGDLQGAAPGLLITQQNSGAQAANISIRGLTYADIEKSQTPTVGVIVDGVVIGTNTGQLQDAFDIGQLEVLRGPQGTLFGANTIGGVISIQRSKPTMEPGLKAEFTYGRFNTWSGKAIANLGDGNTWGAKLFYFHNETDGFYRNAIDKRSAGGSKNDTYGGSVLFKPAGSDFDAQLTVQNVVQSFEPVVASLAKTGEVFCGFAPARQCNRNNTDDVYTVFTSPSNSSYKAPEATLTMNLDTGGVKLTSITGWRKSTESQTQDFDGLSTDLYYTDRRQHYKQWSQELRASGKLFSGFDYVVGGFYFKSDYDLVQWTRLFAFSPTTPVTSTTNPQYVEGSTESYALFGDFNWAFADKWRLSFGGRYSHDNKQLFNGYAGPTTTVAPEAVARSRFTAVGTGDASFNKFTPKVGLDYRPNSDTMLYASWSRGYRSGGFSPRAATAATAGTPFRPETVDAYEIGGKFDLLDRKLQINIAGYVSDYKNMQQNLTVPGGPTGNQTVTGNVAGGALIKGIELDGTLRPIEGLRLTASAAIMDSNFRNFVVGCVVGAAIGRCDYSNNNLIYAPKFTGSLEGEYVAPTSFGNVTTTFGWRHISPYDQQLSQAVLPTSATTVNNIVANDPRVRTVTQDLLDASLTVNFKLQGADAYVRVFGRNLADVRTTTHAFTVAGLWSFGMALEPRTYGATVGFKF